MKQSTIKVDGKDVLIWESDAAPSWRMVYDGPTLIALFYATGITSTKYSLFEGTQTACLDEAKRLGLKGTEQFERGYINDELRGSPKSKDFTAALLLELSPFTELAPKLTAAIAAAKEKTASPIKP